MAFACGVVALPLQGGTELNRGDEEAAGFADGFEVAVHFDRSCAVAVAEYPAVHFGAEFVHFVALVGDGFVGDARVDHCRGEGFVSEQGRDGIETHAAVYGLGRQGVPRR